MSGAWDRPGGPTIAAISCGMMLAGSLFLVACAASTAAPSPGGADSVAPIIRSPATVVLSDRPWTYFGIPGRMIVTPSYKIFTTERDALVARRIPAFLELALANYRTMFGELPAPGGAMETYILASRTQWAALTRQLMGKRARVYLKIRAGGFASQGRALLFNIGSRGTFATTSHEGWHQYTQRTFREPLPIWLEEGLATLMEGYRWDEDEPDRAIFLPWANIDRFARLRELVNAERQFSLIELLDQRPQDLLNTVDNERALDYYSQVWALAHFLREGQDRRYREGLGELLARASRGGFYRDVQGRVTPMEYAMMVGRRSGPAVFKAYFSDDLEEASRAYDDFLRQITETGARDRVAAGRSPVR